MQHGAGLTICSLIVELLSRLDGKPENSYKHIAEDTFSIHFSEKLAILEGWIEDLMEVNTGK